MKNLKLFVPLGIFLVLAVFLLKGLDRDPNAMPSALLGKPVPPFRLPDLIDETQPVTEAVFQGQPALLNVWGTWCVACRVEHPFLMDLAKRGVPIIGVNYKDERSLALRWLEERGDPYRANVQDSDGTLGVDLGVFGAPETYLVDSRGVIRYKHIGVLDEQAWSEMEPMYSALKGGSP